MLEVFDRQLRKIAILENALDIVSEHRLNRLSTLSFSLPEDDSKAVFCQPFSFLRHQEDLYRLLPAGRSVSHKGLLHFSCEHVWGTLADTCIFGFLSLGGSGTPTRSVLEDILSRQNLWRLGDCHFSHQYAYGFSQETLLSALMAVPACFTEPYRWDFDLSTSPWTLHLRRLDVSPTSFAYLNTGKNLLSCVVEEDLTRLCTRLYPLGYGEGVNQLTIASVNSGIPYLQSPQTVIDKYGIIERVWTDRQYEDAASLKAAASRLLLEMQEPYRAYEISLTELSGENISLGDTVRADLPGETLYTYVTAIRRRLNDVPETTVTVANRPSDLADAIAQLADKARIESSYAQGATNLYAQSLQANADPSDGASLHFFIPEDMRQVNKVLCKVKLERFRTYSKATSANGGRAQTLTGSTSQVRVQSSRADASVSVRSQSTSAAVATQTANVSVSGSIQVTVPGQEVVAKNTRSEYATWHGSFELGAGATNIISQPYASDAQPHVHQIQMHTHYLPRIATSTQSLTSPAALSGSLTIPGQTLSITIPGQTATGSVTVPGQSLTIPAQTISLDLPDHAHDTQPGVFRFGSPQSFTIKVNGIPRQTVSATSGEFDLAPWLATLQDGRIGRNRWHSVEIVPNDLAYVVLDLFVQGFVQSRGDFTL